MKIVKWGIIAVTALAVIGPVSGGDVSAAERDSPARVRTTTTEVAVDTETGTNDQQVFEHAVDVSVRDMDTNEICPAIDVLGLDLAVQHMHNGFGSGYWSDAYAAQALRAACN